MVLVVAGLRGFVYFAAGALRVQEALRAGLGLRLDVAPVAAGSLPRFELKARRVVRRLTCGRPVEICPVRCLPAESNVLGSKPA
jgi:hypothetical protein